ncbi:unnamed protein product [Arabis nemorensis]|uniref:GRF-type domain-containing protein n=1 Tax=Arabis nemorensis TaxID=586526 RepID=A0A565BS56_9BRAS|nr:unnamed protein product [Arabis nemorensis]
MAQSASSSNIESNNENGVLCNYNRTTKIVRAWTKDNPGRRFYGCPGRKIAQGYQNCNFFRWYDLEKPNGWQHLALLEARDIMRGQKEEIKNLKEEVKKLSRLTESVQDPTLVQEELKQTRKECEGLKRDVFILTERSRIYRNVLISTTTVGFTVALGFMVGMWKQQ